MGRCTPEKRQYHSIKKFVASNDLTSFATKGSRVFVLKIPDLFSAVTSFKSDCRANRRRAGSDIFSKLSRLLTIVLLRYQFLSSMSVIRSIF
jgi:hypothetical protein